MTSPLKLKHWFETAVQHQIAGDLIRAEALYRRVLGAAPNSAPTLINLSIVLKARGSFQAAEATLRKALALEPENPVIHNNLGGTLAALNRPDEAFACLRRAIKLDPNYADARVSIGTALRAFGHVVEASTHLARAVELDPRNANAYQELGAALRARGYTGEAKAHYEHSLALAPRNAGLQVKNALLLPQIPRSLDEGLSYRRRVEAGVARLRREGLTLHNPISEVGCANFYMAYQGLDDRPIQEAIARLYIEACPSLVYTAPHCRAGLPRITDRPIRIGCVSRYFRDHAISWTFRHYFDAYPPERFQIHLYTFEREENAVWNEMCATAHASALLPECDLARARRIIARHRLDVLIYPDIGMEPCTYFLAFARLAHVQCVAGGHPVTTGIPNLDYWIGNDLGEPEGAEAHYSERLLRIKGITNNYRRPELKEPVKDRAALGLPRDRTLYVCPQSLFKLHPELDAMLGAILRGDPNAVLILFEGPVADWARILLERLARSIPDVLARVRMLGRRPFPDFLNTLALADVILDTIHFGGGNTSFQAFAVGTPIVTLEGAYARGRVTAYLYRHMGIDDCIAASPDEYVEIALRIGRDPAERARLRALIGERAGILFENESGSRELRDFFADLFAGNAEAGGCEAAPCLPAAACA